MTISSVMTFAYSFKAGGIYYYITSSANLTVEVTKGDNYGEYSGVVDIPQTTSYNGVSYTVTGVGTKAFSGCYGLTKVIFPQTVTTIGDYAFTGCNTMEEIVIPATITKIGNYVFNSCSNLSSVQFEFDKTTLYLGHGSSKGSGYGLFFDCPLKSITLTRPLNYSTSSSDGYSPFAKHPTLESAVFKNWTNTGNYLLYGCTALTSVTFPDFATTINDYAFSGCKSLKTINIPATVTTIGKGAFSNCYGFSSFTITSGVESIGDYCFAGCIGLKSFTFPVNLTKIGNYAFNGCTAIKELVFEHGGNKNLEIGSGAANKLSNSIFYDCPLESVTLERGLHYSISSNNGYSPFANHPTLKNFTFNHLKNTGEYLLYGCGQLTSVNLGTMVTINEYAFANCKSLSAIDIPATVTTIGNSAFKNCNWFTSFKIGTGVETIGDYCFAGCISMDDITIPGSVTTVGNYAFANCTRIKKVSIEKGATVLYLGYGASKSDKGLFFDCPLETVSICRGINYSTSSSYGYSPFANHSTLTTATFGDGATGIGNYLFYGDAALNSVTMTKDMTRIGNYALYGCVGIKSFVMGVKNEAGDKLYSSVETIGDYAFSGCKNLTGLIFPPSLTSIGNFAFRNCTSFNNFAFEEGTEVLSLGNGSSEGEKTGLFRDCPINDVFIGRNLSYNYSPLSNIATLTVAKIGNPVTRIPNYIFQGDNALVTLHFNKSCKLTSIGKYAFAGCSKLPSYTFPETLTAIDEGAFQNCTSLTTSVIGKNVETVGAYAFDGCNQLTGLIFYTPMKSIGNFAFRNCTSVNNLDIEESEETLTLGNGSSQGEKTALFRDCPINDVFIGRDLSYNYAPLYKITTLTEISFGNLITRIPNYICQDATELSVVKFNKACKANSVGKYAFDGCSKLSSLDLPESVKTYEEGAFRGCTGLTSLTIPATVTNIGNYVFCNCKSVTNLVIEDGTETLTMGYGASQGAAYGLFRDCPLESLYLGRTLKYTENKNNGYSPFAYVNTLSKVTLGTNVKSLGYCMFYTTAISEIYLPSSVSSIHSSSLNNCSNLKKVIILGVTPPTTDTYNTLLTNSAEASKFYVFFPENYKSTKIWKDYADKIESVCELYSNFTYSGDGHVIGYKTDFPIVLNNRDTEAVDAGTYQKRLEVTYQTNGYSINDILNYEYTIKKAPLTITARSYTRYYGKENPEFEVRYQGFVNGEDEKALSKEPIASTKATISSPAGEYAIEVSGAEAKNYEMSYVNGILTILPMLVGDFNGDDKVDNTDLQLLVDYIMGKNPLGIDKNTADLNKDDKVNAADVTKVIDIIKKNADAND